MAKPETVWQHLARLGVEVKRSGLAGRRMVRNTRDARDILKEHGVAYCSIPNFKAGETWLEVTNG